MSELRLSSRDQLKKTLPETVRTEYLNLPLLDNNIISNFHGIAPDEVRTSILERSLIEVMKDPGWLQGPVNYDGRPFLLDRSGIDWLTELPYEKKAKELLENSSSVSFLFEKEKQSIIIRGLELLSQRHSRLSFFRCHIFDTSTGIQGSDFSFGSVLSEDICNYALPTAFPVLAILPMTSLIESYKSRLIKISSEGSWDRDSMEIYAEDGEILRNKFLLFRIDRGNLKKVYKVIDSPGWKISEY